MAKHKLSTKKQLATFRQELNELLFKYDLFPNDEEIKLSTDKVIFSASDLSNCKPACVMKKKIRHPDGTIEIKTWCDKKCQEG